MVALGFFAWVGCCFLFVDLDFIPCFERDYLIAVFPAWFSASFICLLGLGVQFNLVMKFFILLFYLLERIKNKGREWKPKALPLFRLQKN